MTLQDSVLKTIKYSDHFDYPLLLSEIHLRLISTKSYSLKQVSDILQQMLKNNQIEKTDNFFHLPGKSSLVLRRLSRVKTSTPQLIRAKYLASRLSKFRFIKAIYLTGSLAMNNSKSDSDIDFMIITNEGRLWTTRFILTLYTTFLGLRRTPRSHKNAGKLCLNLYLTPDSYHIPLHKQSLYTAYELIQATPLHDPSDTRSSLLTANPWIKKYLSNVIAGSDQDENIKSTNLKLKRSGIVEYLLFQLQYLYMRKKLTREYITLNSAFFHPNNPAPKV